MFGQLRSCCTLAGLCDCFSEGQICHCLFLSLVFCQEFPSVSFHSSPPPPHLHSVSPLEAEYNCNFRVSLSHSARGDGYSSFGLSSPWRCPQESLTERPHCTTALNSIWLQKEPPTLLKGIWVSMWEGDFLYPAGWHILVLCVTCGPSLTLWN
jgi:hypothetical protein